MRTGRFSGGCSHSCPTSSGFCRKPADLLLYVALRSVWQVRRCRLVVFVSSCIPDQIRQEDIGQAGDGRCERNSPLRATSRLALPCTRFACCGGRGGRCFLWVAGDEVVSGFYEYIVLLDSSGGGRGVRDDGGDSRDLGAGAQGDSEPAFDKFSRGEEVAIFVLVCRWLCKRRGMRWRRGSSGL